MIINRKCLLGMGLVDTKSTFLTPWFIGSYGENDDLFETLLLEMIRDHIEWRRDFHTAATSNARASQTPDSDFSQAVADMKQQISHLASDLKNSFTINSPRYFGHMSSDLLLPGLIAQLMTALYNPTNITGDVAPVLVDMELEAGVQIADMLGFNTNPAIYPCAWGHITSAGNTANYDSLWNARAISCYPLALKAAANKLALELKISPSSDKTIAQCSSWKCQNFSIDEVLELQEFVYQQLLTETDRATSHQFFAEVKLQRVEHMGMASFFAEHWEAKQPIVLVPTTTCNSWVKALKLLGFGGNQLIKLDVDNRMRIDINSLERILVNAEHKKIPILAVVGILGTTEFGSIDPLAEIVQLRDQFKVRGLNFYLHIDASWGGYLSSIMRNEDQGMISLAELQKQFKYFPSQSTYDAFSAIKEADSVTVDPHKMGYLPFGTGAFISKNREITNITKDEEYTASEKIAHADQKTGQLAQYILEGTKPGSIAVSCCLTQRILPLNNKHFGQILSKSIHASEYFYDRIKLTIKKLKSQVNIVLPMEPDTNIFCLALNPVKNTCLTRMNRFSNRVYQGLKITAEQPEQNKAFFCSQTSLLHQNLGSEDAQYLLKKLGINESSFVAKIKNPEKETDSIDVLRHTLLNPWLLSQIDGDNYIDRYCDYLEKVILEVVKKESSNMLVMVSSR